LEDAFADMSFYEDSKDGRNKQPQMCDVARENQSIMNSLLRTELLGHSAVHSPKNFGDSARGGGGGGGGGGGDGSYESSSPRSTSGGGGGAYGGGGGDGTSSFGGPSVLRFQSQTQRHRSSGESQGSLSSMSSVGGAISTSSSLDGTSHASSSSAFGPASPGGGHRMSSTSPKKSARKIPRAPYKILDAPALGDDYYLNLVDWSSTNIVSVALGSSVYLWSACTSKVTQLCDLGPDDSVTSICWAVRGTQIAVGTNSGKVQIWDVGKQEKVRDMSGHSGRVGTMAWSNTLLATGSRDRAIYLQDMRVRGGGGSSSGGSGESQFEENSPPASGGGASSDPCVVQQFTAHKQEVCGLKWSPDERMLASGGNDNKLFVWSLASGDPSNPTCRFSDHTAAVKAVAWSPHQHGLLASGGGTADRNIRVWNSLTSMPLHRIDTGSQVCNLMWSKNVNEIVSTHGYSLNQVIVWRYPSMQKLATLTGHSMRVLYLAMSPDGQSVVTGAGDETLRFWNLFPGPKFGQSGSRNGPSLLFAGSEIR